MPMSERTVRAETVLFAGQGMCDTLVLGRVS